MNVQEVKQAITNIQKGSNVFVEWERPVKTKKGHNLNLTKKTRMLCRIGVEYDNKAKTQEERENGTLPIKNAGLKGFKWIEHKTILQAIKSQKLYLRLEKGTFKSQPKVEYKLNGKIIEKEDYKHCMLASEIKTRNTDTFNVKLEDIITIH